MFLGHKRLRLSIISIILIFLTMSCNFVSALNTKDLLKVTPSPQNTFPTFTINWNVDNQIVFTEQDVSTGSINSHAQNPDFKLTDPAILISNGIC